MSCRKKIDAKISLDYVRFTFAHSSIVPSKDSSQSSCKMLPESILSNSLQRIMDTEVRTLKQELARTQEALRAATRRCRDLVRELDNRSAGQDSERALRDQQLSRILRALLVLEARLKQEQKSIRQLLCEKDQLIRNQQLEIATLRRYTKNYIKCNRENGFNKAEESGGNNSPLENASSTLETQLETERNSALSKDIRDLKCEIITRLIPGDSSSFSLLERGIKKTHSFAESDISKTSLTSSEYTDVSMVTTTTDGSPSLLSTEGFCEGDSTDVSPGSTLNKSNRCTPTIANDSENEITVILNDSRELTELEDKESVQDTRFVKKNVFKGLKKNCANVEIPIITRSDSNDDGMDCNFASDDDDKDLEPVYENSNLENRTTNLDNDVSNIIDCKDFSNNNDCSRNNNNNRVNGKVDMDEPATEESSGNWYSDPDEDRINDDALRHSTYRPSSNHNSVLECVNQILLRDMEEEENALSMTRRYKQRGKVVRFQAKLSDIESVGSEIERRNSEESSKESTTNGSNEMPRNNFEATSSEDEFGMKIIQSPVIDPAEAGLDEDPEKSNAIPLVIIEPKEEKIEEARNPIFASIILAQKKIQAINPPLKMERIEEKTCLEMSSKGLTIAKNLDYEDIESLPGGNITPPKTPPALPPKPQFRNNTLILKKIPSPSFLIVEGRKKQQLLESNSVDHGKKILNLISSPLKTFDSQKYLNFDEPTKSNVKGEEMNFWRNKFNNVRSSFQRQTDHNCYEQCGNSPKVTNMVRHFEEFKIGDSDHQKDRNKPRERYSTDLEQGIDIRQNFEEFNLDECDLSDDPDRLEGDGSERLGTLSLIPHNENPITTKDNNNVDPPCLNSGYDNFLEATGLSNKSILTPSRLLSNHKSMLKPKDVKYKSKIKATAVLEKHGVSATGVTNTTHVKHWTGPFV
ncbi:uncharacterized protein [Prorops nasuta]|uniref:uncharacterized protein isoform X2 n=1 Tax=Prorops nasuta TaxID=863751 RepID=UPI0034CDAC51